MIALQLYTIRDLLQDPAALGGVLARVREIGYRAVEVAGLGPSARQTFGRELARSGLVAFASHASLDELRADPDGVGAECREWGCEFLVVPALPNAERTLDGYRRFAAESADLAATLRRHGLQLVYHNHAYELERFGGRTGLEVILDDAAPDALQVELDTYWLQFGGAHPAAWIRRYLGRVPLVHCKDMAVDRGKPFQTEVGEGNLDWTDILDACREAGTKWLIVEQDESRRNPMESVAVSYENLSRLIMGAGLRDA
jgi:sugar phosphate isomerase/epimerase